MNPCEHCGATIEECAGMAETTGLPCCYECSEGLAKHQESRS